MHAPPDPEMRRGAAANGTPEIAKKVQKQTYQIPLDVQAALCVLLPTFLPVLILALAGARQ